MAMQERDTPAQLTNWLDLISGKQESYSPKTETTQGNLSMESMQQIITSILGGTQGLAAVSQGQKSAGIYNSTTNQQLVNDLLSKTSVQVAAANAGKTTTVSGGTKQTQAPGIDRILSEAGLKTGISMAASPVLKAAYKKSGLEKGVQSISEMVSGTDVASSQVASPLSLDFSGGYTGAQGADAIAMSDAVYGGIAEEGIAAGAASAFGTADTVAAIELGDAVYGGTAAAAGEGAATAAASKGAGEVIAEGATYAALAVICTESVKQGLLSKQKYLDEVSYNRNRIGKYKLRGYHLWAVPVVLKMRKNRKYAERMARWADLYIDHTTYGKKSFIGFLGRWICEPLCAVLGFAVTVLCIPEKWRVLYAR